MKQINDVRKFEKVTMIGSRNKLWRLFFLPISELYEGLKMAQRGRLDDQRGTEINFEMPDFLKRGANVSYALEIGTVV